MQVIKWATLFFGAIFVVVVAGAINAPHLYYMAAILLTLPGISYGLGWFTLRGLLFEREPPSLAWAGEEGEMLYYVQNASAVPRYFISCRDSLPAWVTLLSETPPMFNAAPNSAARVVAPVKFERRGVFAMQGFEVTATDPLGVFAFSRQIPAESELIVYPLPLQMQRVEMLGAERYGWQEFTNIALRGSSVDPDGVRVYVPGDPLRRIHWRQTARTGQLSVIEFEEPQSVQAVMVLDCQKGRVYGSGVDTSFEAAVRACATIAYQATEQGAGAQFYATANREENSTGGAVPLRGQLQLMRILDTLARLEPETDETIADAIRDLAGKLPSGATVIAVTSNPDPALADALLLHRGGGCSPVALYIDPLSFDARARGADAEALKAFSGALQGANTPLFVVRRREDGAFYPEVMHDGYE